MSREQILLNCQNAKRVLDNKIMIYIREGPGGGQFRYYDSLHEMKSDDYLMTAKTWAFNFEDRGFKTYMTYVTFFNDRVADQEETWSYRK